MFPFNDIQIDQRLYTRELQTYLRRLSRIYPVIPRINIDGVYGSATGRAVGIFQRRFGLPETRQADRVTWETIVTEHRRLMAQQPQSGDIPAPSTLPLKTDDRGGAVAQLREWLQLIGESFGNLPAITSGDVYTPQTAQSVARMQQILLLPVNGITNYPTWRGIASTAAAVGRRSF